MATDVYFLHESNPILKVNKICVSLHEILYIIIMAWSGVFPKVFSKAQEPSLK